jgi:uncharacterized membrane protein YvbJ
MKSCLNCGATAPDDMATCPACGRDFSYYSASGGDASAVTAREEHERTRPDGSTPRTIGWILIVVGVLLGLWSGLMSVTTYSFSTDIDPDKVAMKALLAVCAEGAFGLGLILWLAGYIVHAISFLPGKEDKIAED